jgi:PhnB protein
MTTKKTSFPRGFRTVTPCLTVKGIPQAIEFYKTAFGAVEQVRLTGADDTLIVHAELKIGNSLIVLNEESTHTGILSPLSLGGCAMAIHLYVEDVDQLCQQAVEAGAAIILAPCEAYWGDRWAKLQDPFGHCWSVATRVERLSKVALAQRAKEAFLVPAPHVADTPKEVAA